MYKGTNFKVSNYPIIELKMEDDILYCINLKYEEYKIENENIRIINIIVNENNILPRLIKYTSNGLFYIDEKNKHKAVIDKYENNENIFVGFCFKNITNIDYDNNFYLITYETFETFETFIFDRFRNIHFYFINYGVRCIYNKLEYPYAILAYANSKIIIYNILSHTIKEITMYSNLLYAFVYLNKVYFILNCNNLYVYDELDINKNYTELLSNVKYITCHCIWNNLCVLGNKFGILYFFDGEKIIHKISLSEPIEKLIEKDGYIYAGFNNGTVSIIDTLYLKNETIDLFKDELYEEAFNNLSKNHFLRLLVEIEILIEKKWEKIKKEIIHSKNIPNKKDILKKYNVFIAYDKSKNDELLFILNNFSKVFSFKRLINNYKYNEAYDLINGYPFLKLTIEYVKLNTNFQNIFYSIKKTESDDEDKINRLLKTLNLYSQVNCKKGIIFLLNTYPDKLFSVLEQAEQFIKNKQYTEYLELVKNNKYLKEFMIYEKVIHIYKYINYNKNEIIYDVNFFEQSDILEILNKIHKGENNVIYSLLNNKKLNQNKKQYLIEFLYIQEIALAYIYKKNEIDIIATVQNYIDVFDKNLLLYNLLHRLRLNMFNEFKKEQCITKIPKSILVYKQIVTNIENII